MVVSEHLQRYPIMLGKKSSFAFVALCVGVFVSVTAYAWVARARSVASASASSMTVLKLAHGLDPSHPVHKAMLYMAQRLGEISAGTVELQVFPGGILGSETENIAQLQRGALAMTKVSAAAVENFVPQMAVFSLPYIFRDANHYWQVLDGPIGRELLSSGEKSGLKGLCYYDAGSRNFYTITKPILSPADLVGMKIRTMTSKTCMDTVQVLGASPTPVPWGELYTALQQKMVDGAENNLPSFYTSRHYEVCKHFVMDEHTRIPDILMISTTVWDGLSPQVRNWVQQAADDSSEYQRKLWAEYDAQTLKAVEEKGVKVYYPDKALFVADVQSLLKSCEGSPVGDLVQKIRSVK
jgi:tripartite ATP-independent transporter DctP family solute receptor